MEETKIKAMFLVTKISNLQPEVEVLESSQTIICEGCDLENIGRLRRSKKLEETPTPEQVVGKTLNFRNEVMSPIQVKLATISPKDNNLVVVSEVGMYKIQKV